MKQPKRKVNPLEKLKPKSSLKNPNMVREESLKDRTNRGKAVSKGKK